jgi:uncharacterized protein YuzE
MLARKALATDAGRRAVEPASTEPDKIGEPGEAAHAIIYVESSSAMSAGYVRSSACRRSHLVRHRLFRSETEGSYMRLKVDKASDALYFRLDGSTIVDSEEVRPGVILDFNERGQVVGVEFLGIHARMTEHELTSLHFEAT